MKEITLVLKHHWFDMIASGQKTIEYRENKEYWRKRLIDKDTIIFTRGYNSEPFIIAKIIKISIGKCPIDSFNYYDGYFKIQFKLISGVGIKLLGEIV